MCCTYMNGCVFTRPQCKISMSYSQRFETQEFRNMSLKVLKLEM